MMTGGPASKAMQKLVHGNGVAVTGAPDKWGRDLLDARARLEARESGKPIVWPTDIDRLFAVEDETRQGALRFRRDGEFLSHQAMTLETATFACSWKLPTTAASSGIDSDGIKYMHTAFEGQNRARAAAMRPTATTIIDTTATVNGTSTAGGAVWVHPHTRRGQLVEGHFRRRRR